MPAPLGNRNSMLHGTRGALSLGRYPKGCSYIRRIIGMFRMQLETSVQDSHDSIGVYHAALIQSACRHETRALLLNRWLREQPDASLADKLALMRDITNASDSRDKCLEKLGLSKSAKDENPWTRFRREALAEASEPTSTTSDENEPSANGAAPGSTQTPESVPTATNEPDATDDNSGAASGKQLNGESDEQIC
jgi:hypothetical protein